MHFFIVGRIFACRTLMYKHFCLSAVLQAKMRPTIKNDDAFLHVTSFP
jgi:hypothetical protein